MEFCASLAALTGQKLGPNDVPDSLNVLPALLGDSSAGREHFLEQSVSVVATCQGQWKFIPAPSGPKAEGKRVQQGDQFYDLAKDLGESNNVASEHRDLVAELSAKLPQLREQGRSKP